MKVFLKRYLSKNTIEKFKKNTFLFQFLHRIKFWIIIRNRLKKQLFEKEKLIKKNVGLQSRKVMIPLIETNHYQYLQILITAKALQLRGAEVKVLICGEALDGCEIKSVKTEYDRDPCWTCRYNERNILPLFGLDIVRLDEILTKEEVNEIDLEANIIIDSGEKIVIKEGIDLTQSIEDSVIRYFYGGISSDPEALKRVRCAHTKTAIMNAQIAIRMDQKWNPDVVFNNMGCYSIWDAYFKYYESNGNRFCTLSVTPLDYQCVRFNLPNLFQSSQRFELYKNSRVQLKINDTEKGKLLKFLEGRYSGQSKIFRDLGVFDASLTENKHLIEKLGLKTEKRNIFLFSNIHWDVGLSANGALYSNVIDWVLDTINLTKDFNNCHIYIKPHPAELFGNSSLKGVEDFIREKYPMLPNNITIISPGWKINPYDLFPFIDLGVIFSGTLGLEMMLCNIPVVSTGLTSHKGIGLASEPNNLEEYSKILRGDIETPKIDRDLLDLFAYFYFIKTLMPWRLTKQAYADNFTGYSFRSLEDIMPGGEPYIDHLCTCILDLDNAMPEAWVEELWIEDATK